MNFHQKPHANRKVLSDCSRSRGCSYSRWSVSRITAVTGCRSESLEGLLFSNLELLDQMPGRKV